MRNESVCLNKNLYLNDHSSFMHKEYTTAKKSNVHLMDKLVYLYNVIYTLIKMNKLLINTVTLLNLKSIVLSWNDSTYMKF